MFLILIDSVQTVSKRETWVDTPGEGDGNKSMYLSRRGVLLRNVTGTLVLLVWHTSGS